MPERHRAAVSALPEFDIKVASAMRKAFKAGYGISDLRADVLAGLVVAIVALPLSMALAIASSDDENMAGHRRGCSHRGTRYHWRFVSGR